MGPNPSRFITKPEQTQPNPTQTNPSLVLSCLVMAAENNEFWLPSEFLPDDFFDEVEENEEVGLTRQSFLLDQPNNNKNWSRNTKPSAWDLMLLRMALEEEDQTKCSSISGRRGLLAPPTNPFHSLTHHQQLQINQFNHLKQQQMLKQRQQCVGRRPVGLAPSAWPPLLQPHHHHHHHHHHHSYNGMRAVFLGGRKQPCGGTGVFLPRRSGSGGNCNGGGNNGSPNDYRMKHSGCSTVLLPARVVQALNLNLEEMGANPRFPNAGFVPDHDVIARNNALLSQKLSLQPNPQFSGDFRLPPEWSY